MEPVPAIVWALLVLIFAYHAVSFHRAQVEQERQSERYHEAELAAVRARHTPITMWMVGYATSRHLVFVAVSDTTDQDMVLGDTWVLGEALYCREEWKMWRTCPMEESTSSEERQEYDLVMTCSLPPPDLGQCIDQTRGMLGEVALCRKHWSDAAECSITAMPSVVLECQLSPSVPI